MVEMKWVWHNLEHGAPPIGAVGIDKDERLYQKLQYRVIEPTFTDDGRWSSDRWSDWKDVPHSGAMNPNANVTGAQPHGG